MEQSIYDIEVTNADGRTFGLNEYIGSVMLIVNVASKCGLADRSYKELSALLEKFSSKGLKVLLFPCKQFLSQEHEDLERVREFSSRYHGEFMLMDYVNLKGSNIHPLFKYLTKHLKGFMFDGVKWNFTYFLIGRNGELVKRYGPTQSITVDDKDLLKCIEDTPNDSKHRPRTHG